jgi:ethanolamine ammonia-lyase small subunit
MPDKNEIAKHDPWELLKKFTDARIALGRTGVSIPVKENLQFKMAHAFARDAIYTKMDKDALAEGMHQLNHPFYFLHSMAQSREQYLQRPDLGRIPGEDVFFKMKEELGDKAYDICINIADGLSATAVNLHSIALLTALLPLIKGLGFTIAPVCLIEQGRVAIGDETGSFFQAKISLMLIGERPGLSSPDSLGAYITYHPQKGNTDAMRNCVSNIRPKGLSYNVAADKIVFLIKESIRLRVSGVALKDMTGLLPLPGLDD